VVEAHAVVGSTLLCDYRLACRRKRALKT